MSPHPVFYIIVFFVFLVAAIYGIRRRRSGLPILPTYRRQYNGYTEPRRYYPPIESNNLSSTRHHGSGSVVFPNTLNTQPQHYSPKPLPSLPSQFLPLTVQKPQQHPLPLTVQKPQQHPLPLTVQKPQQHPLPLTVQKPQQHPLPLTVQKPQHVLPKNGLPGALVAQVHRPALQIPVQPHVKLPPPVYQLSSETPIRKPLQPFQPPGSQVGITEGNKNGDNDDDLEKKDVDHLALRELANQEWENMKKCRREEKLARRYRQLTRARELADKAQQHRRCMQILNDEASEVVFAKNNKDPAFRKIDLHGLTVKEAIDHTNRALNQARQLGNSEMRIIVGKGNHSKDGEPKLKPAIQAFSEKHGFSAEVDPKNTGVLVVRLDSALGS